MIDHVTIPVKDLKQSRSFYEKAFIPLGYKLSFGKEGSFWAFDVGGDSLFEISQYQGKSPLTSVHVAFRVLDAKTIEAFFKAAIEAGAKSNGAPGFRPQYAQGYYACFIYDPNGHNIEAMCNKIYK
jgi:catechol 2,3-dioxygenase-like lactoylglutathione lyase family enzyme